MYIIYRMKNVDTGGMLMLNAQEMIFPFTFVVMTSVYWRQSI